MRPEVQHRLARARELLLSARRDGDPQPRLETLEEVARALLEGFDARADTALFEAFYDVTVPRFSAFARQLLKRLGARIDETAVTNRLYALIFRKLTAPRESVPLDYLFPWCYKVIANIAREEKRKILSRGGVPTDIDAEAARESTVDRLIRREDEERRVKSLQWLLDIILFGSEAGFSPRDRNVMRLYYLERYSQRQIAEITGLTQSNVGVILNRTREKIRKLARERL